jgi:hypothetical protein
LIYITLRAIPKSKGAIFRGVDDSEPLLLVSSSLGGLPNSVFYMDNIFLGYKTFKEGYKYLENYLLLRLL